MVQSCTFASYLSFQLLCHVGYLLLRPARSLPWLSPNGNIIVPINDSLTLTCTYTGLVQLGQIYSISWFRDQQDAPYGSVDNNCRKGGYLNTSIYHVTCPDLNQQSITINRVDLTYHRTTWFCEFSQIPGVPTKSTASATIVVNGPARSLPWLSPNGNIIVPINDRITLTCTYTGLVQSGQIYSISWFRDQQDAPYGSVDNNCSKGGHLNTSIYNVTCPNLNQQSITINRVDLTYHRTTWFCEFSQIPGVPTKSTASATIVVNDCTISESLAGYEQETTYVLFNVNAPSQGLHVYRIRNIDTNVNYLSIVYEHGDILANITTGGVEHIGDLAAGNLSIRIPNMNSTYVGFYILKKTSPLGKKIKCVYLSIRVRPQKPEISNKEILDDGSLTIRGTMDQPLTLTCTSTGGFPKSNLRWFRDNNHTHSLRSNKTYRINDDGNYIVFQTYTFTPTRQDDRVFYFCQSSFDGSQPSYQTDEVILYLDLNPLSPSITTYAIVEGIFGKAVICTASQYRPNNAQVWLQIDGYNITSVPDITITKNVTTETFTIVALFNLVLNRHTNGQSVSCHISHDTLQTPLTVKDTIPVYYAPDVEVTASNVTVFDTAILTCKPTGLPSVYTYLNWRHTWPGHGTITQIGTLGNNQTLRLTSLTFEHSGVYHCSASNGVNGSLNPNAGYGSTYLQVSTFPIIVTPSPIQTFTTFLTDISVTIHFYSHRRNNMVECSQNSTKFICASFLEDVDISLPVFNSIVRTKGLAAKLFLSIEQQNYFETFTVTISNDVGASTIEVNVLHSGDTQTMHTEQRNNFALVFGAVGSVVVVFSIAVIVVVLWKRRSPDNTRRNTSLNRDKNQSRDDVRPTAGIEMEPRQGDSYNVDLHVYEDLTERIENNLECEVDQVQSDLNIYYNQDRNTYEDLKHEREDTHEYGTLNSSDDTEKSSKTSTEKTYENIRHAPMERYNEISEILIMMPVKLY